MPVPPFSPLADHFALDRSVCFLNHGSFGAAPLRVLQAQQEFRRRLESEPVRFMVEELEPAPHAARPRPAPFLRCPADGFPFGHHATGAVNTVVNSLRFEPGDELLSRNPEYNACNNALAVA